MVFISLKLKIITNSHNLKSDSIDFSRMPGRIGKYEVLKTLGYGGSCKVKLAVDTETGESVAIKMLKQNLDARTHSLVMNEVQAMSRLKHRNIIE